MTVKELITLLSACNPEAEVYSYSGRENDQQNELIVGVNPEHGEIVLLEWNVE